MLRTNNEKRRKEEGLMKKAVIVFVCLIAVAGFVFMGMPHMKAASAAQDAQKATISHSGIQEVAGYGDSNDEGSDSSDEGDSGGYGSDEGDSGSDSGSESSGGYGN